MNAMASQITSLTIVYSTVYSCTDQRKHPSSTSLAFVRGIHRWPLNSPHKGSVIWKCFHLMTSSCIRGSYLCSICTSRLIIKPVKYQTQSLAQKALSIFVAIRNGDALFCCKIKLGYISPRCTLERHTLDLTGSWICGLINFLFKKTPYKCDIIKDFNIFQALVYCRAIFVFQTMLLSNIHMNLLQIYGSTIAFIWLCDVLRKLIGEPLCVYFFLDIPPFMYICKWFKLIGKLLCKYFLACAFECSWIILYVFHVYKLVCVTLMLYVFNHFMFVFYLSRIIAVLC